jgi:hypothetical protein
MLRNGERMVGKVHVKHDQRPETFTKSRSHFKNKEL